VSEALLDVDFAYVTALVRRRAGMCLDQSKNYLVQTRLEQLAPTLGYPSLAALLRRLRGSAEDGLHTRVVEAMLVQETLFFRDTSFFEALRSQVLPELLRTRRPVRIWSAACARGQEPYSVAMLVADEFPGALNQVRIIASDLSGEVVEEAGQASYSQLEVNRGLPARLLVKHFERDGARWRLRDNIRRMVELRTINLIEEWPPLFDLDVILLRNVLIYFDVATKRAILARARERLTPGGTVFLGGAETAVGLDEGYVQVPLGRTFGYRRRSP
jgi:chemotaxis protein methyltransferase CheR